MGTTLGKKADGYGYKYTELSQIHEWLEEQGITYYQYIEPVNGDDYIYTVPIIKGEEKAPRRGCKVIIATLNGKSNPAQEQGSGITYARRYSLLMAFGLATADDDAQCMTQPKKEKKVEKVEAEEVKETPKEKKPNNVPGYPSRNVMMTIVEKHYPEGSDNRKALEELFNVDSIYEMSNEQICAVYDKFGGR